MARRPADFAAASRQQMVNLATAWLQEYAPTEAHFARAFERNFHDGWRYNTDEGWWLQWVGTHWAREQTPEFLRALGSYIRGMADALFLAGHISPTERKSLHGTRTVKAIATQCSWLPMFLTRQAQYDRDPFLLGTPGGTVELKTGLVRPADPEDYITMLTSVAPAPAGTPAPMWEAFLAFVTGGDPDVQRTLQEWIGSSSTGEAPDQRLVYLFGQGGNGKSVFLQVIARLLGAYHQAADPGLLVAKSGSGDHPTGVAKVAGARMVSAMEVPHNAAWNTALIKFLTGGDTIATRRMHQNFYDVVPSCSITAIGNEKPALNNVDEAIRRRFLLIDFGAKVEKPIRNYDRKMIKAEGPAILRWAIDGAVARLAVDDLFVAPAITTASQAYFSEEDMVRQFLEERCELASVEELAADPGAWETRTTALFDNYRMFTVALGRPPGSRNPFSTKLAAISGLSLKHTKHGNVIVGLRLSYG